MSIVWKLAKALWALPVYILGGLFAIPFLLYGFRFQGGALVIVARGPLARALAKRGWRDFVIGVAVILWVYDEPTPLKHALAHVAQWKRLGLLFPAVYGYQWARYGYRAMPLELEAYRAAGQIH